MYLNQSVTFFQSGGSVWSHARRDAKLRLPKLLVAVDLEHQMLGQYRACLRQQTDLFLVRFSHRSVIADAAAQRVDGPQLRGRLRAPEAADAAPDRSLFGLARHPFALPVPKRCRRSALLHARPSFWLLASAHGQGQWHHTSAAFEAQG